MGFMWNAARTNTSYLYVNVLPATTFAGINPATN